MFVLRGGVLAAAIVGTLSAAPALAQPGRPVCDVELARAAARPGLDDAARFGGGALIRKGPRRGDGPHYVALTFDDGPDYETTPSVLDALDAFEVTATFFVVGWRFASQHREKDENLAALREVAARGFPIGNHTFEHEDLRTLSPQRVHDEIDRNARALEGVIGYRPHLFRAPYGRLSRAARQHLRRGNYTPVGWSIDPHDYRRHRPGALAERTIAEIIENRGGVVVLHDTKPWTARELPRLLQALETENCERRERGDPLLIPVTLDYFMRDEDGGERSIGPTARAHERRYLARLARECPALTRIQ